MMQKYDMIKSIPLYKNSLFIMLNSFLSGAIGVIFWIIAARLYTSENVGVATALISSSTIIGSISSFGLGTGLIKFFPKSNDKSLLFSSVLIVSLISSLIIGFFFIVNIHFFSPALKFIFTPWFILIFLFFLLFQANSGLLNTVLLALRKAEYSFAQNLSLGIRIILLFPLTFTGAAGIFESLGVAFAVSSLIGIIMLSKNGIFLKPNLDRKMLSNIAQFSLSNYIVESLTMVQAAMLPILILNVVGSQEAAHFYIAFSIASLLYAIPNSIFMSMFIECSHGKQLTATLTKSFRAVCLLMVPVGLFLYFFGNILLSLFSNEYSQNSFLVLKILVIASIFMIINSMFTVVKKVQNDIKSLIEITLILFVSTLFFSYLFMLSYGVVGVGIGWTIGQGIAAIIALLILKNDLYKM